MCRYKTTMLLAVFMMLMIVFLASVTWGSVPDWNKRPGTIFHAKSLTDGSHVTLDAVIVEKIRAKHNPSYFTIRECFSSKDKIVVLTPPSPRLRLGQDIDVEGVVSTLANGQRAIISPTVWGYGDKTGKLLVHGPLIKGLDKPTSWPWKINLTVEPTSSSPVQSGSVEPNEVPPPGPKRFATIHDVLNRVSTMALGDFISYPVELLCKPIASLNGTYFVMGEDGSQDTIKVYYSGVASMSTSQRVCRMIAQLREGENSEQVLCVDSGPGYDPQDGEGSLTLVQSGTIAWAKTLQNGASVTLGTTGVGKIVTCALSSGCFYIEEDDRSSGIRVEKSNHGRWAGDRAYVVGTMGTTANGERYINATTADNAGDGLLKPLGKNNRWLGGGDFFYEQSTGKGQRGITGASGLNDIGLLVRIWGKVTAKDTANPATWFRIDDGSGVGVKVDLQTSAGNVIAISVQVNDYVYATGISSCEVSGDDLVRVLRPGPVVQPAFSPPGGVHCYCLGVTAKSAMLGDILRYTTSGADPGASSTVYDPEGVMIVDPNMTLKARVYRDTWVTAGAVASAYYYKDSSCNTGNPPSYTCYEYYEEQLPTISGLRLEGMAPGMMQLDWDNVVYGGFDVQRDTQNPVQANQSEYTDNFSFSLGTTYSYKVRARAYTGSTQGLPARTNQTEGILYVPYWTTGPWKEISVTPQKVLVSQNQAVDSRTDTRYVEDKLVDFQFDDKVFHGGLFVGNANDPSRIGRSFLKFDLTGLQGQLGTNDRFWTANLEAYYTRSFANGMSTDVGYHFVSKDSWDAQSVVWSNAPALNSTEPQGHVAVSGATSSWYHWNAAFPDFTHELYGDHTLSVGLASKSEGQSGWAYFAKKEYDAALSPHILYAYGKYEDGGAGVPPIFVAGIRLSSYTVTGGYTVRGTVILNCPAPTGGYNVYLSGNCCVLRVPSVVHVAEGALTASFVVSTAIVSSPTEVTISAFDGSATLHINP